MIEWNKNCELCDLHETATPGSVCIPPDQGAPQAPLLFVGEAPGAREDRANRPFVGPAGRMLREGIFSVAQIPETCVTITNTVNCWPGKGNPDPKEKQIKTCMENYLLPYIEQVQPMYVVAVGRIAAKALLGKYVPKTRQGQPAAITNMRGQGFWQPDLGMWVIPIFHPAACLRDGTKKRFLVADLRMIRRYLERGLNIPDVDWMWAKNFEPFWDKLAEAEKVYLDIETEDLSFYPTINVIGVRFDDVSYILESDDTKRLAEYLVERHTKYGRGIIGHNVSQFDMVRIATHLKQSGDVELADNLMHVPSDYDTLNTCGLIFCDQPAGLKYLSWQYTNLGGYNKEITFDGQKQDIEELARYCAYDCWATELIMKQFRVRTRDIEERVCPQK